MAALFWRCVWGFQLVLAGILAALIGAVLSLTVPDVVFITIVVFLLLPAVFVVGGFVLARLSEPLSAVQDESGRGIARLCRAQVAEVVAFTRASLAMLAGTHGRCLKVEPPQNPRTARPVLLIHGIVCNRAIWRALFVRLRAAGFAPIRAIDLEPLLADIESCARSVEQQLLRMQRESGGARVTIVAHSMGGLVARAALRSLGPDVISRIVTIGSPHHGTAIARHFPSRPTRQMCPDSAWLRQLNADQEGHLNVPITSIYSVEDNFIIPARSAVLRGAQARELRGIGHLGLLASAQVIDCVMNELTSA